MHICRFHLPGSESPRLGWVVGEDVLDLTASADPRLASLSALLCASLVAPPAEIVRALNPERLPRLRLAELDRAPAADQPHLLAPVDRQEVWAAGVTYAWSREARVREARAKEVYVRVYEAARPELFFKALPEKVVGPHDWIGLRGDSAWNVPEPELALVLNPALAIVGYTVANDVSSRDIEGENPLYLPQAKIYRHSCALGPLIALAGPGLDAQNLTIRLTIRRAGATAFAGETSTAKMNRTPAELASYLGRYNDFPYGAVLLTGTGIVPGDDFTLRDGDEVIIEIEGIGCLRNPVRQMAEGPAAA
jgi:2-dehydro-3-deoxy-D-arabinonate dehydratase